MSKIIIVEPNPNDKDQIKAYLVKGERGYSAYDLYVQNGGTLTEEEWLDAFLNADNYYSKDEVKGLVIDNLTSDTTNQPLSAKQGKVLKGLVDGKADTTDVVVKDNIVCINGSFTILTSESSKEGYIDFPSGFDATNCVVLSFMLGSNLNGYSLWMPTEALKGDFGYEFIHYENADDSFFYSYTPSQALTENETWHIKTVLMKIDPDVSDYELGDINMDGEINQDDLTLLYNYLQGTQTLTDEQFKLADMNEDGKLAYTDYTALYNKINNS